MIRKYRPIVRVLKEKKGVPTKINVSGQDYALIHENNMKGTMQKKKTH